MACPALSFSVLFPPNNPAGLLRSVLVWRLGLLFNFESLCPVIYSVIVYLFFIIYLFSSITLTRLIKKILDLYYYLLAFLILFSSVLCNIFWDNSLLAYYVHISVLYREHREGLSSNICSHWCLETASPPLPSPPFPFLSLIHPFNTHYFCISSILDTLLSLLSDRWKQGKASSL